MGWGGGGGRERERENQNHTTERNVCSTAFIYRVQIYLMVVIFVQTLILCSPFVVR